MRPEEATSAQEAPEPVEDAPTLDTDLPSEAGEEGPVDGPTTPSVDRGALILQGLRSVAAQGVVVPGPVLADRPDRAARRPAECGDPLGDGVGEAAHELDLGVDHLVDADEVRPHDVPVHVLEGEVEVVVGAQPLLKDRGEVLALLLAESGNGVGGHVGSLRSALEEQTPV